MITLLPLALSLAHAAPSDDQVLSALTSATGWTNPGTSKDVEVTQKAIPGLDVPAFRGNRTVPVSCDAYWVHVRDIQTQGQVNDMLRESKVLARNGQKLIFLQVVDLPLISDRYWINVATNTEGVDGQAGHYRQTWSAMGPDTYSDERARVEDTYGAVLTTVNYGFWDLTPAGQGQCNVTYAAVSDPGGSIPGGAGSWASEKSLPDNINAFLAAAQ